MAQRRGEEEERRRQYADLRHGLGLNDELEPEQEDTSRSIRLKIGDVFNVRIKTRKAITIASIIGAATVFGVAKPEAVASALPAFITRAWVEKVDKAMSDDEKRFSDISDEIWALRCEMNDEWRWAAIQEGNHDRARYLAARLQEMSARAGRQCP